MAKSIVTRIDNTGGDGFMWFSPWNSEARIVFTIVPRQNSIHGQDSEFTLTSILLFCVNYRGKGLRDRIFRIVLSWILRLGVSKNAPYPKEVQAHVEIENAAAGNGLHHSNVRKVA